MWSARSASGAGVRGREVESTSHTRYKGIMATCAPPLIPYRTVADVLERVGNVPPHRILLHPGPGTATALNILDPEITDGRAVELVDGILVEKATGTEEVAIGVWLAARIVSFAARQSLGRAFGAHGGVLLTGGLVRIPAVSFIRWDSVDHPSELDPLPGPFLHVAPDLVVEVLSEGNTPREMTIKLAEYNAAGVKLVWYVDPDAKTVTVSPKGRERGRKVLGVGDTLDGGKVLPGFALPVADLFAPRAPKATKKKGKK
jgi:Uma2 family endonuclease